MKRYIAFSLLVCCTLLQYSNAQVKPEIFDSTTVAKIRDEGLNHSKVMETLSWLSDVYGPRLTGSPAYIRAAEWVMKQMKELGMENIHREGWMFGKGWELKDYAARVIGQQTFPLISFPKAWSPELKGEVEADVVFLDAQTDSALETYKGKLKGKFILFSQPTKLNAYFAPPATRVADSSLLKLANAEPELSGNPRNFQMTPQQKTIALVNFKKLELCQKENAAAILTSAPAQRNEGGSVFVMGASVPTHPDTPSVNRIPSYSSKAPKILPQVEVGAEQYNRMVRMIQKGEKIKIAMELEVDWFKEDSCYNVIAEIPGTDLKDEVVMIGAHLDSWHSGTGATDNGTGSAVCMEAMRILKSIGAKPKRTIRMALWGGEEQGLLGSRAYTEKHFGKRDSLSKDAEKFCAYFNNDNGTGKVRGIYLQGNDALRPIFRAWLSPFKEMGATTLSLSNTGGTDHLAFDALGLPGFQFIQDPIEYGTRTWHSTMDVYDRAQEDDVKQAAILMASFAYNAAMRDEKIPRKILQSSGGNKGAGYEEDEHEHSH